MISCYRYCSLSVSDTSILLQLSDLSIAVVRQVNKIGEIKQMFRVSDQIGNDYAGIVYNGYEKLLAIMVTTVFMEIMLISIMQKNIYTNPMITMKRINFFFKLIGSSWV